MLDMPVGQLVKLHRLDRKMSIVQVATHAGISARYLEMIEAGSKTPALPTLRRIAKVLHVRTSALVGDAASEDHQGPVNSRLAAAERALQTFQFVSLVDRPEPPDMTDLAERVSAMQTAWFTSTNRFADTLDVLPDLIVDVETAIHATGRSHAALRLACAVYHVARTALKHAGRADLGGLLADRNMRYAEETGDRALIAAAAWNVSQAMLSGDMPEGALEFAVKTVERLEPMLSDATPELFAAFGGLQLNIVIAHVRMGDPWRGRSVLRGPAAEAARRVQDGNNHLGLAFGPSNVAVHGVSLAVEAGEITEALRLADEVNIGWLPSLERQTTHIYQVARAYEQKNNDAAVLVHLQIAHRISPQDFVFKPNVKQLVTGLVRRARPSFAGEVRAFASTVGLLP